jgi:diguanylate cyclase (GGDEF)-like protein/PAS domain S-box-containing protein
MPQAGTIGADRKPIEGWLSARASGRLAGALFVACGGLGVVANLVLPSYGAGSRRATLAAATAAVLIGTVVRALPWERWPHRATRLLVPVAFAVVAVHNTATGGDGFRYALFFVVPFVWIGLTQPPLTSLAFAPLFVAAYLAPPLLTGDGGRPAITSAIYAVPTCLLVGEMVAWVSDRLRRSEAELRLREERFRALVQHGADAVSVVSPEGVITYDAPSVARVLGVPPGARVGTPALEHAHPDDRAAVAAAIAAARAEPGRPARLDVRVRAGDGTWRWCEAVITNLLDEPAVRGFVVNLSDITERRRAAEGLAQSEASFRLLFTSNPEPMWVVDTETLAFLEVNEAAVRHYGYSREQFLAMRLPSLLAPGEPPGAALAGGTHRHLLRDGRVIDVETTVHTLPFAGRPAALVAAKDVTEQRALEDQLRHQAFHDPLTGLANRALFRDRVEHALARRRPGGRRVALLLLDLDGFKTVNDSLGHAAGDVLLEVVARRVADSLRTGDTAARLGGDEFVVLLDDVSGVREAVAVAERVREALRAPVHLAGKDVFIRASIGIALHLDPAEGPDELLRNADAAMYAAKAEGRGAYRVFEPSMHTAAMARLELDAALRRAIAEGELAVHYQPVVRLADRRIHAVEALVRWHHPDEGLVGPARFITAAEEGGLIPAIGRFVLQTACSQAQAWAEMGMPVGISVNVSGRQLAEPGFVGEVARVLESTGLDPATCTLEITESVLMCDTDMALRQLGGLKALGVRLAIDDFGTGYSSLSYLRSFPVDALKIDKAFVEHVTSDVEGASFVQAIVRLARTLHLETTAEGVETEEQARRLTTIGCDSAQGYWFSAPLDVAAATTLLVRTLAGTEQTRSAT